MVTLSDRFFLAVLYPRNYFEIYDGKLRTGRNGLTIHRYKAIKPVFKIQTQTHVQYPNVVHSKLTLHEGWVLDFRELD